MGDDLDGEFYQQSGDVASVLLSGEQYVFQCRKGFTGKLNGRTVGCHHGLLDTPIHKCQGRLFRTI